jgi:hypothetical protein
MENSHLKQDLGLRFVADWLKTPAMKRFALISALFAFFLGACERHDFEGPEGTKRLHEHHGSHGEDEDSHH